MKEVFLFQFTNKYGILKGTILFALCAISLFTLAVVLLCILCVLGG